MTGHARTAALAERKDERHRKQEDRERRKEEGEVGKGREEDTQKTTDQQNAPESNPPKDPGGRS
jgi:hypothetical protein